MEVLTTRFGKLLLELDDLILFPQGLIGFPGQTKYCVVDPGDDTLILWLQSLDEPDLAFPILEPKIFYSNYIVKLSHRERKALELQSLEGVSVFCILTIPEKITEMTANLKAPVVIHSKFHLGKQVILQESMYVIKYAMFKELKKHLLTVQSIQKKPQSSSKPNVRVLPRQEFPCGASLLSL